MMKGNKTSCLQTNKTVFAGLQLFGDQIISDL